MYNTRWTILVLLFGLMLASAPVVGQGLQTGVITGTSPPPTACHCRCHRHGRIAGAAISGTAATDVNGNYVIRGLPPGDYTVTVEMNGMASRTEHTAVALGRTTTLDAEMASPPCRRACRLPSTPRRS